MVEPCKERGVIMGSKKSTFQYKETISINRDNFLETVVRNDELSKKDLRVLLHLLTHLDSLNYRDVSKKQIAFDLNMPKKDVTYSIENLVEYGVISEGSSASVSNGLKLLF